VAVSAEAPESELTRHVKEMNLLFTGAPALERIAAGLDLPLDVASLAAYPAHRLA
jgi:hypothetical protein